MTTVPTVRTASTTTRTALLSANRSSPSRIDGNTLSGSVTARLPSMSSANADDLARRNAGLSIDAGRAGSRPAPIASRIAPESEEQGQARGDEAVQLVAVAGRVEPGDEPDDARGDAQVKEGEVGQDRFDERPDPVRPIAEPADQVRGEEEPDEERRGERQPVRDGPDQQPPADRGLATRIRHGREGSTAARPGVQGNRLVDGRSIRYSARYP